MIRVLGANPALDHVSTWPELRLGDVNRATLVVASAGGKSLNVARAVRGLGGEVTAYGFLGGHIGSIVRELVRAAGVVDRHISIGDETRICFVVVGPDGRTTILNEPGPAVTPGEIDTLLGDLREDSRPDDIIILSGSLPDRVEPSVAGQVIAIGNEAGARTICDIHGAALISAVEGRPWMVKCNLDELRGLIGHGSGVHVHEGHRPSLNELAQGMRALRERGVGVVVVTLGPEGALLADEAGTLRVVVPQVPVVSATGAGDVLLAGLVVGVERGMSPREAIVLGAACGTASVTHLTPGLPEGFAAEEWISRIGLADVASMA
jgi:1-phosphofructokinase family hexose kinase